MFNYIKGTVSELTTSYAVLETNGIGFHIYTTAYSVSKLKLGDNAIMYITEVVKEDSFDLYGFCDKTEKEFFELLTSVSGIGPKVAVSILSSCTTDTLINAIVNNNESVLTTVPGIGKKTAQRVILELKDKVSKGTVSSSASYAPTAKGHAVDEAIMALNSLGYSNNDINQILRQINVVNMSSGEIIRSVLKYMVN